MDKKIFEFLEKINIDLQNKSLLEEEQIFIEKNLKTLLPKDSIVLAQTNPLSGDIKSNTKKALQWIKWAEKLELGAIVFPELFLIGCPIGDAIDKFPIIVDENIEWLKALATQITKRTKVIIGFIDKNNEKYSKTYHNAVAVLSNGKIERIIHSTKNPEDFEYNDYKHLVPSQSISERIIEIGNKKACLTLSNEIFDNEILDKITKGQTFDYILNCKSTNTRTNTTFNKNLLFRNIAQKYKTTFININQVGATDTITFDGISCAYNKNGQLISRAKLLEEQFVIVSPSNNNEICYLPKGLEIANEEVFTLDYEYDLERIYLTLITSIKDYFKKTGFKLAVLGLSGGLDSTISAVLLADALGKENVYGISMPSKITTIESKNDAKILAENLGINFIEMPIKEIFDCTRRQFDNIFEKVEKQWSCRYKESFTNDNIQARSRAIILWGIANEFEACLPIATSDKSELYMGYATINGDMSGGFAPLADVTKTKLFALAEWMNKNRQNKNAIPQSIINKRPGAELAINPKTGKPLLAEEALMPYEFLDEIIWRVENLKQTITDLLDIEFVYEKKMSATNPVTKTQKLEWLQKFFKRMSSSIYKSTIMPPSPIIDTHSINNIEYKQPIVSSKINFSKTDIKDKIKQLES